MTQRKYQIKNFPKKSDRIELEWNLCKGKPENIRVILNQNLAGFYATSNDFGYRQVFQLIGGEVLTIVRKKRRFGLFLNELNLIAEIWKTMFFRMIGEMSVISGVLFLLLMLMDGLSWLISSQSMITIWPKGRLSTVPFWMVSFALAGVRLLFGKQLLRKTSWVWFCLVLFSLIGELRLIRSVYEFWFFAGITFVFVPILWLGTRAGKTWRNFGY